MCLNDSSYYRGEVEVPTTEREESNPVVENDPEPQPDGFSDKPVSFDGLYAFLKNLNLQPETPETDEEDSDEEPLVFTVEETTTEFEGQTEKETVVETPFFRTSVFESTDAEGTKTVTKSLSLNENAMAYSPTEVSRKTPRVIANLRSVFDAVFND